MEANVVHDGNDRKIQLSFFNETSGKNDSLSLTVNDWEKVKSQVDQLLMLEGRQNHMRQNGRQNYIRQNANVSTVDYNILENVRDFEESRLDNDDDSVELPTHPWQGLVDDWEINEFEEFGALFEECTSNLGDIEEMDNKFCEKKE